MFELGHELCPILLSGQGIQVFARLLTTYSRQYSQWWQAWAKEAEQKPTAVLICSIFSKEYLAVDQGT